MQRFLPFVLSAVFLGHTAQSQGVGALDPKLTAASDSGYCAQLDWNWFVGKELGIVVDSLSLEKFLIEVQRRDHGETTYVYFHLENAGLFIEMNNYVDLSYLFQGVDDPHRVLRYIRVDPVRHVHCF